MFDSPQDVIAERGQDWDEQLDEIAAWRSALAERGLAEPLDGSGGTGGNG